MLNFIQTKTEMILSTGISLPVYLQQFAKQTACIRSSTSSKLICLLCVLLTDSVMHCWSGDK